MSIGQRLYPNQENEVVLVRHCSDSRFVYNLGLEQRNFLPKQSAQKITYITQARELVQARKSFSWLAEGSSVVQQAALRDLDIAFRNWWNNPRHFSHPTWRKSGINEGFYVRDLSVRKLNRKWGEVLVPKAGLVRFRLTRTWTEIQASSSARITLDSSFRWHVSFTQSKPELQRELTGTLVGLDMGIASSVTTSDGTHLNMSKLLSSGEKQRKRRLQRKLSRQKKGSKPRTRTNLQIAKLITRESGSPKDWVEKTITELVCSYDLIVIEDLKVENMSRSSKGTKDNPGKNVAQKRGLNRSQAWALFRKRLKDKAANATSPVLVIPINPKFTSQTCPQCEEVAKDNRKSQAVFSCIVCGHTTNANINTAKNILTAGLGPLWGVTGRRWTLQQKPTGAEHSGPVKRQLPEGRVA